MSLKSTYRWVTCPRLHSIYPYFLCFYVNVSRRKSWDLGSAWYCKLGSYFFWLDVEAKTCVWVVAWIRVRPGMKILLVIEGSSIFGAPMLQHVPYFVLSASCLFTNPVLFYGQIGKLMKAGQADEAQEKKREVDSINEVANSAEESLNKVWLWCRLLNSNRSPRSGVTLHATVWSFCGTELCIPNYPSNHGLGEIDLTNPKLANICYLVALSHISDSNTPIVVHLST